MEKEEGIIPNSLNEHWMPFSANREFKENPRLIVGAQGVYLKDHLHPNFFHFSLYQHQNT